MEKFENNISSVEPVEASSEKKDAIDKFFTYHLTNIRTFRNSGDPDSAFTAFHLMIIHLKNWGITDEETGISLETLAKEQGLFHLNFARRLKGRRGVLNQLEKLNFCVNTGNLQLSDLETSEEEIENLKNSISNNS